MSHKTDSIIVNSRNLKIFNKFIKKSNFLRINYELCKYYNTILSIFKLLLLSAKLSVVVKEKYFPKKIYEFLHFICFKKFLSVINIYISVCVHIQTCDSGV